MNDDYLDDDYYSENILGDKEGCCFLGECCMPSPHYESECYTAETAQDYEAQFKIPECIDYLVSRGFTVTDFQNAIKERESKVKKTIG